MAVNQGNGRTKFFLFCGILALTIFGFLKIKQARAFNALVDDAVALNFAVEAFKSSGDEFWPNSSIEQVLKQLKAVDRSQIPRTHRFHVINQDLVCKMQSEEQSAKKMPRTLWNTHSQKFEVKFTGERGAIDFYISDKPKYKDEPGALSAYLKSTGLQTNYDSKPRKPVSKPVQKEY